MCVSLGVVWQIDHPIANAFESLATLQKMGKQVYLVTNNSIRASSAFSKLAHHACLDISPVNIGFVYILITHITY